jgi:hypothetical protein
MDSSLDHSTLFSSSRINKAHDTLHSSSFLWSFIKLMIWIHLSVDASYPEHLTLMIINASLSYLFCICLLFFLDCNGMFPTLATLGGLVW